MFDQSFQGVTVKICYNKKLFHHKSDAIIMFLISASGIRHYFPKVHNYSYNLCEFGSGTLIKFQFVVHFKSAVTFFHGNGNELLGVKLLKGPATN